MTKVKGCFNTLPERKFAVATICQDVITEEDIETWVGAVVRCRLRILD